MAAWHYWLPTAQQGRSCRLNCYPDTISYILSQKNSRSRKSSPGVPPKNVGAGRTHFEFHACYVFCEAKAECCGLCSCFNKPILIYLSKISFRNPFYKSADSCPYAAMVNEMLPFSVRTDVVCTVSALLITTSFFAAG